MDYSEFNLSLDPNSKSNHPAGVQQQWQNGSLNEYASLFNHDTLISLGDDYPLLDESEYGYLAKLLNAATDAQDDRHSTTHKPQFTGQPTSEGPNHAMNGKTGSEFHSSHVPSGPHFVPPSQLLEDPAALDMSLDVDSDHSWDEEGGWAAFRAILKKQLHEFAIDKAKTSLPINPLPRSQRVMVHTIADTYGFSHRSHGRGKMRSMTIYKTPSWENPSGTILDDNSSTLKVCHTCSSPQSGPLRRTSSTSSSVIPRTFSGKTLASLTETSSLDFSLETQMTGVPTVACSASEATSTTSKKRRRNPKIPNGYHCGVCEKAFDRECEKVKHEQYHLEYEKRPYKCNLCTKGFILQKDLKSHQEKAHPVKPAKFFF